MADQTSRYGKPEKTCDIVMKGGITSGVVYPLALATLAEKYRFSNIGGTSAGAIAAAAAAAAEYGRHTPGAGFDRLAKIPNEVGPGLLSMFQPAPALKPLFNIFIAALKSGSGRRVAVIWSAIRGYWLSALFGLAPGVVVVAAAWWYGGGIGFMAFGALLALTGLVVAIVRRLLRAAQVELPAGDFGLCPGISQPYSSSEGFTDWLARLIHEAAGRKTTDDPLTFGDLSAEHDGRPAIRLAMMTTSLMEQRPYTLPFPETDHRFVFAKSEWARIFPCVIMEFLTRKCTPLEEQAEGSVEYYYFPDPARLPLVVGARMSLSFPFLIAAVPLWRKDFTLVDKAEQQKLRRCLFSDGGLSSNFPIHFFDRLLPNNPTFAISLDDYYEKRSQGRDRVWLPKRAGSGIPLPVQPIEGLIGFAVRLVMSAKDWQDNLRSTLPGYRERIAHVVLKPEEGGLNLTMDEATIRQLVKFGEQAGEKLKDEFDLDGHRWRRFLVAMARDPTLAQTFIGLGLPLLQGYGLTEASPVISVNRDDDNDPESVGVPLPGLEVKLLAGGELAVRGPNVMLGYWRNDEATRAAIDAAGFLHTGDVAELKDGKIYIRGRAKDILVLSNGEKLPPQDVELALLRDPVFEQVMLIGEGRPFPILLAVTKETDEKALVKRANDQLTAFPRWMRVRRVVAMREPWDIESGLLTPTLKLRRPLVVKRFADRIDAAYAEPG